MRILRAIVLPLVLAVLDTVEHFSWHCQLNLEETEFGTQAGMNRTFINWSIDDHYSANYFLPHCESRVPHLAITMGFVVMSPHSEVGSNDAEG